jgi:polyisoprenoid-binding protein YceI
MCRIPESAVVSIRREELVIRSIFLLLLISAGLLGGVGFAGSLPPPQFHIVPSESRVWFDADAPLHSFRGQTQDLSGAFTLQQTSPPQITEAKVMINAASLKTGNSERDADMYRDFLEVERFPRIELHIGSVQAAPAATGETSWDVVLHAQLTVHGTTRSVQVPATVDLAAERVTARGQIHLDMRDFNIRVPRILLIPMQSQVLVGFDVTARPVR